MEKRELSVEAMRVLTYVGHLTDQMKIDERRRREHIALARKLGASWRMIGVSVGTSTQSAWEQYRDDKPLKNISADEPLPGFTDET